MRDLTAHTTSEPDAWWVVCLCAAWCNTCTDYRAPFDAMAREWPQMRFEWLDIEDESDIAGDLDVETFPTVLVADGQHVRFVGPLLPHAGILNRLIISLRESGGSAAARDAHAWPQAQAVFDSLRRRRK